ncbi:peptide deformylase [Thermobrachium celere]|uniref:Peptide deformylase n=1 Tax=Thermobrachium celere DSM 8682 TaxID=941824 RepID=R7RRA5_9CLOT|nr:peptide deformylase [Thermobrachium celere]GFR35061.1 peptide deformylase [Thermobrachium celere]CDF57886.1 Peptide deformylase [Thermobrachium celere DSM 8682]
MALRQIRKIGDDVLRKVSKPVTKFDERLKILVEDMIDTMYEADGVGLAAPQVGILKRVIVIDVGEGPKVYINPEIIYEEGEQIDEEGCLSVPNRRGLVKRPYKVRVKAQDLNGNEFIEEGEELLARAFCHEIDHLNGILFIDKIEEQGE